MSCWVPGRLPADFDIVLGSTRTAGERAARAFEDIIGRLGLLPRCADALMFTANGLAAGDEILLSTPAGTLHVVGASLPDGTDRDALVSSRQWWAIGSTPVPTCTRADLIAIKSAVGSPRDVQDVVALQARKL